MTEEDSLVLNIENEPESEKVSLQYSFREGVIFVIDASESMFEIDPEAGTSYFAQCLETYKRILSDKLSWNKTDWMGIVLLGTKKWDQDPEIKNVLTWIKFEEASIDQMTKIEKTLENVEKFHTEIGTSSNFPLYDALWYAARCFSAVKIRMPYRNIIILTRCDYPYADSPMDRGRLRIQAADCADSNIQLSVVGLGKEWSEKPFFQEFDYNSGKIDKVEDYQRTFLGDLEEEVKHASRITSKVQWTLGNNVKLGVSVSTITAKSKFSKKIYLKKENNEPLDGYSYMRKADGGFSEDEEEDDEYGETDGAKIALPKNVYKYQKFGGRDIKFSMQEAFRLPIVCEPGIKLLGFKPQNKLDVSLHLEAPKLVSYNETELRGSRTLFAALLKRCESKKVMAICVVTLRSATYLYAMIPRRADGGFYAYKLPFAENVREFTSVFPEYVYNETDNKCPIDQEITDLCYKFIKKTTMAYDPTMFLNPKLRTELAHIESLAMDKDASEIPIDCTIPDKETVHKRLGALKDRLEEAVRVYDRTKGVKRPGESSPNASTKFSKDDETLNFEELVEDRRVEKCTVKQLKDYLRSVGATPVGRKAELVNMVYSLFNKA